MRQWDYYKELVEELETWEMSVDEWISRLSFYADLFEHGKLKKENVGEENYLNWKMLK